MRLFEQDTHQHIPSVSEGGFAPEPHIGEVIEPGI